MFKSIYSAALTQDTTKLNELIRNPTAIDTKEGHFTPAGLLAKNGNFPAAEWLRLKGAQIDPIAFGAGAGNHKEYALKINALGRPIATTTYLIRPAQTYCVPPSRHIDRRGFGSGLRNPRSYSSGGGRLIQRPAIYGTKRANTNVATIDWIAAGAAFCGLSEFAEELRIQHFALLSMIVEWSVRGSNYNYINKLSQPNSDRGAILDASQFLNYIRETDLISTAEQVLYILTHVNKNLRKEIVRCLAAQKHPYAVLFNKANLFSAIMTVHALSYKQAIYYDNAEINEWFLLSSHLLSIGPQSTPLPFDIAIKIMCLISNSELSEDDAKAIYKKLFERYYRLPTIRRFEKYIDSSGVFHWIDHKERATSLIGVLGACGSTSTMVFLLHTQLTFFNNPSSTKEKPVVTDKTTVLKKHEQPLKRTDKEDEFYKIVAERYTRFTSGRNKP